MIDLLKILNDKISSLDKHLQSAVYERDHSATPMESHSDKSRQLAEQVIDSLSDERKKTILLKLEIAKTRQVIYTVSTPQRERKYLVVPDGLGGQVVDNITLVSNKAPLGEMLISVREGDSFVLNNQQFVVEAIVDN